jgi:PhzF family phenazine biosynthesis protein
MSPSRPDAPRLRRLTAFSEDPRGGNPAGVWIGTPLPAPAEMQRIATEVGYSETAFATRVGTRRYDVRYFSPEAEVPFCGHATIATGVVLGERDGEGTYTLQTRAGPVPVAVHRQGGRLVASLTSVEPEQRAVEPGVLEAVLVALHWRAAELDDAIPPRMAYAGAWHLVIAVRARATLDRLDYDFPALKALMLGAGLTTLQLIWREDDRVFHARNPFPVGGVVEDPATGAAAAALGGYLRDAGLITPPLDFTILQGLAMGRPSTIQVAVPVRGGITVTGTATPLD